MKMHLDLFEAINNTNKKAFVSKLNLFYLKRTLCDFTYPEHIIMPF